MNSVEVLLKEHVKDLGRCGEVVRVAAGYARNYLMPQGLAIQANAENKRQMDRRSAALAIVEAQTAAELTKLKEALSKVELSTSERADDAGHLFGSVNAGKIAELLSATGFATEEKNVRLESPLRTVGEHIVQIHLAGDESVEVKLTIVKQ